MEDDTFVHVIWVGRGNDLARSMRPAIRAQ